MIHEQTIRRRIQEVGISISAFATISRVDATKLNRAFIGERDLSNELVIELLDLSLFLSMLNEAVKPFTLPKDAKVLGRMIDHLRKQETRLDQVRETFQMLFAAGEQS